MIIKVFKTGEPNNLPPKPEYKTDRTLKCAYKPCGKRIEDGELALKSRNPFCQISEEETENIYCFLDCVLDEMALNGNSLAFKQVKVKYKSRNIPPSPV